MFTLHVTSVFAAGDIISGLTLLLLPWMKNVRTQGRLVCSVHATGIVVRSTEYGLDMHACVLYTSRLRTCVYMGVHM